ncbi:MAG: pseudouridine-5'-phosphate glycosidase [Candidatus Eisenbacteria bacterium]|uniref:Pseudouridine-5'-phosphate glycosidase n=1 Tax=Eiseniibacteriota bacterium TaxID=2212470 RepID=A0A933SCZ0_UNCEI|nr:pseudouridine-5'-phosphate glycosidase [Candidatus Eisenbacteria bacterium]
MKERFVLNNDVDRALAGNRAIVALETTVVTHGLPHPQGVEAALLLEDDVRQGGAVPATIGVWGGEIHVGITRAELEALAAAKDVTKLNLSNFAATLAAGRPGSTTVAATMFAAHHAGIPVFATGGIGGVHRESQDSGDVSADLTALSRLPVAVVCAGAKAILDLPRTVEMLETLGVPVFGLRTKEFPAFYRRESGLPVDHTFDTIEEMAAAVSAHFAIGMGTGVLVANPIPEDEQMPLALYTRALGEALAAARTEGVRGRAVTPFLLDRMRQVTGGESVRANLALLRNNARVAAKLAVALSPRD